MTRRKVIIDTDPGIDDAMAVVYAAAHPDLELIGLTSIFGNVSVATATRNALRLVELNGLDIPVAEGAAKPLRGVARRGHLLLGVAKCHEKINPRLVGDSIPHRVHVCQLAREYSK